MTRQYNRRPALTEGGTDKKVRPKIGRNMKLDTSEYERAYPDKKLMWLIKGSSDFHQWLRAGAQPVPESAIETPIYKGLNDNQTTEWVTRHGGVEPSSGKAYELVLLMIDAALYEELKIQPELERQQEIDDAMRLGHNTSDLAGHLPGGGGIQTYAPNLPDGGVGYNSIRSTGN